MDSKFYEPEVLKQLQGEILSILDDFIRICEDYHLEYFGDSPERESVRAAQGIYSLGR